MIKNVAVLFYLKKRTNSKEEKVPVYVGYTAPLPPKNRLSKLRDPLR